MNMSTFVPEHLIKPLTWLGKRDWLNFEKYEGRFFVSTNRRILEELNPQERKKYPADHWQRVRQILNDNDNDKERILSYALSKSLAMGAKMFRPTSMQCQAFENTAINIPFQQYGQPYETLLVEFPREFRQLKEQQGMRDCPKYVICWWHRELRLILAACQFANGEKIVGLLSLTDEEQSIEDLFTNSAYYEADGREAIEIDDFQIAQMFERMAINLNLLIMYGGSESIISPINRELWSQYRELKKRYKKQRNKQGLENLRDFTVAEIDEIKLTQEIGFKVQFDEKMPPVEATDRTHASPHPHWRRGHWCNQPHGPGSVLRKPVLRPPRYVVGRDYRNTEIDLERTSVIYKQEGDAFE